MTTELVCRRACDLHANCTYSAYTQKGENSHCEMKDVQQDTEHVLCPKEAFSEMEAAGVLEMCPSTDGPTPPPSPLEPTPPPQKDCEVGDWEDWGTCNEACGGGITRRTRT